MADPKNLIGNFYLSYSGIYKITKIDKDGYYCTKSLEPGIGNYGCIYRDAKLSNNSLLNHDEYIPLTLNEFIEWLEQWQAKGRINKYPTHLKFIKEAFEYLLHN